MKYLIYGEDNIERQKEVDKIIDSFLKKGLSILKMSDASFEEVGFLNEINSTDLFGDKKVLVLTHCLSTKDIKEFLEEKKKDIEETTTPIIFVESKFLKKDFPSFKKAFEKISEHKAKIVSSEKRFNTFGLVDAIISGDKKNSWLLFRGAIQENISVEEIINLLFWQYKTLLLVSSGGSAETLGMKPFVYNKSKKLLTRFSKKDLQEKMFSLIELFQDVRFEKDGEEKFEKLILS
jgi:DNA polymerase III delta subunit